MNWFPSAISRYLVFDTPEEVRMVQEAYKFPSAITRYLVFDYKVWQARTASGAPFPSAITRYLVFDLLRRRLYMVIILHGFHPL